LAVSSTAAAILASRRTISSASDRSSGDSVVRAKHPAVVVAVRSAPTRKSIWSRSSSRVIGTRNVGLVSPT
jgi:hypothetical protein